MNETTYIYICHSDIDEANIYAEFATEEEAIAYAERHIDDLTYVDKVEVALDEDGEIIEMFDSDTIWIYFDSKNYEADSTDFSEDTDDGLYEDLVEAMEENEDMVECKECFELFPKADGIKIKVGYLCPHCHGHSIKSDSDFYVSEKDFFNTDFPEVEPFMDSEDEFADACAEPVVEPECVGPDCEAPVEAPVTKEETVATLVKDEHEAIDGYDKAEVEVASNPELDPEEKEEIIDTLRHIKDEEVEHIEELEELIDGKTEEPVEDEATSLNEGYTEFHPVVIDKAALEWLAKDLMRFGGSSPFDVGIATGGDGPYYDGNLILDLRYEDGIYFAETYIDCGNGPQEDPEFLEEVGEHESLEDLLNALQEQGWVKLVLDESLEEETHAKYAKPEGNRVQAYNNALAYAKKENTPFIYGYTNHTGKFFALEQPIKVKGDSVDAEKDFKNTYKNCNVVYVAYPNKSFIKESLYNFTEEEMETYGIDEDGYEVDGYGDWVRCNWCKEPFPKEDCVFELNMGWLCDRCQEDIYYHGGPLTTTEEPTEDQIRATLNESGVIAAAVSGILVDVVRRIFDKAGEFKKKSKWIDYKKYIIEKTPEGQVNIWNFNGEEIMSDLKTVEAAKNKIKTLPKPSKFKPLTDLVNKAVAKAEVLVDKDESDGSLSVSTNSTEPIQEDLFDWTLDHVGFDGDTLETNGEVVSGDCTVYGHLETTNGKKEETIDDAIFDYNTKKEEVKVNRLSPDFTETDIANIETDLLANLKTNL